MKQIQKALLLAVALPLAVMASENADPLTGQAVARAAEVRANAGSARGVAALYRLHELRDDVSELHLLGQAYQDVLGRRGSHPEVRRVARMLLADIERARGRLKKADELLAPLGFIDRFYIAGSFDNEGKAGCDVDHGPESNLDLEATFPTRAGETRFRALEGMRADGYVDLSGLLRPNKEAVAYAVTFLEAPADGRVELGLGTTGAFRLWVNDQKVLSGDDYNFAHPDQARVSVKLRKGVNRVMLKVCQESGPFGFYLRQQRAESGGVAAKTTLPTTLPELPRGVSPQPQVLPTLATLVKRDVDRRPNDAALRGDYAVVLAATGAFDGRTHLDRVEAERAADLARGDERLQLFAAIVQTDDHNARRRYLARALEAAPDSPLARLAMAHHELAREHPHKAVDLLEPLVKDHPGFLAARFTLARAWADLGELPRAVRVAEAAFEDGAQVPAMVRDAARLSRRLDRVQEAIARYRVAVALRFDDRESRRALASLLVDTAKPEDAADELHWLLRLDPLDNRIRLHLGELLAANGELDEGLKQFADAAQLAPDEPEVHERRGQALLRAGKREEALAAFGQSLRLRPQNPSLREVVRAIQGERSVPGLQYAYDVSKLVAEADAFSGQDVVFLADYTYTRVQSSGLSSRFHQLAVKLNTQRGVEMFRQYPVSYSPNRQDVQIVKVRITHPDGSVVESYGETEQNINEPWSGMYYDARSRVLSFPALSPGDVLELQYRLEDTARENLLSDYWGAVDYVQSSAPKVRYQFIVDMPAARPLYWNRTQLGDKVQALEEPADDGRKLYRWTASNVERITPEPSMPGWAEVATTLHVSTYKTWEDVGRYYWGLVRDQLRPNDELRRTVDEALKGVDRKDELAVVRALYNFVVTNTRYVALEFGIHGYKPYRVDRVLARRFGDCKDKASLIHAMLEVAGIDSRLVLLRMRSLGQLHEEPASLAAFNHAILYVPKFDLYLDGTASFHGAHELPTADRAANVLLVEPGGKSTFLTTPEAKPEDNLTSQLLEVKLLANGSAEMGGQSQVTGVQAPDYRRTYQATATRKARFEQAWGDVYPGLQVSKLALSELKLDDAVSLDFGMRVPRFAEVLPTGMRFHAFGSGRNYTQVLAPLVQRKYDLVMSNPWASRLTVRYSVPEGYAVDALPSAVEDDTPFGRFTASCSAEAGSVVCQSEMTLKVARVNAADYGAFRSFLGRVDQAYARKVTLKKISTGTTAQR